MIDIEKIRAMTIAKVRPRDPAAAWRDRPAAPGRAFLPDSPRRAADAFGSQQESAEASLEALVRPT